MYKKGREGRREGGRKEGRKGGKAAHIWTHIREKRKENGIKYQRLFSLSSEIIFLKNLMHILCVLQQSFNSG
jgi:hypothetical protein